MNALDALAEAAAAVSLMPLGHFPTDDTDGIGPGTLVLLGPREPGFWDLFTRSPEWRDGRSDPMDRWSRRVVSELAQDAGGHAFFPFGDPLRPFMSWAIRTGRAWSSPVGLLVHDAAGLFVSYRGAILIPGRIDAAPAAKPCDTCPDRPCLSACPPRALTSDGYDLDACHRFLDSAEGAVCMSGGCRVRHACPVSRTYRRVAEQSAYHMRQFHP